MKRSVVEMAQANLKVPRGTEGYWKIIKELDEAGPWTITMVEDRSNVVRDSIRDFVRRLVKAGFAEKVGTAPQRGTGKSPSTTYQLRKKPLMAPRLDRDGRERDEVQRETLWRAMKMLGTFDAAELARVTEKVAQHIAYKYLLALNGAGIVAPIEAGASLRSTRFRLVMNLGARAPIVTKVEQLVFDPNSGKVIGEAQMVEVSP